MSDLGDPDTAGAERALFGRYRRKGKTVWIEATGLSMLPSIPEGTWLLVDFAASDARLGEIAVFRLGNRVLAHRVVDRQFTSTGPILTTKGDSRLECDPPLTADHVLGVVRALRRGERGAAHTGTCSGARSVALAHLSARGPLVDHQVRRLPAIAQRPIRTLGRIATRAVFSLAAAPPKS